MPDEDTRAGHARPLPAEARIGMDGTILAINDTMARWLGIEPEAARGAPTADLWPPDDVQTEMAGVMQILGGQRETFQTERLIFTAEGKPGRGRVHVRRIEATGTEPEHLLVRSGVELGRPGNLRVATHEDAWGLPTQSIPIGLLQVDLAGRTTWANPAACELLGSTLDDLCAPDRPPLTHPDDETFDRHCMQRALDDEIDRWIFEKRMRRGDGEWIWVLQEMTLVRDHDGHADHFLCQLIDVTTRRVAEEELRRSRQRFEGLASQLPVGILETDGRGKTVHVNPAMRALVGRDPLEDGISPLDLIHEDDRERVTGAFFAALERHDDWTADFRVVRADGSIRWVTSVGRPCLGPDGTLTSVITTWQDVTDSVVARQSATRFVELLDQITDPVSIIDGDLTLVYANPAASELMGHDIAEGEFADRLLPTLTNESSDLLVNVGMVTARATGRWTGEIVLHAPDGSLRTLLVSLTHQLDPETGQEHVTTIGRDITELKAEHRALAEQATRDPLTGVANRSLLYRQLEAALPSPTVDGTTAVEPNTGVLFVDLDRFKAINDQHGHQTGDLVLIEVARRLLEAVRPGDTVARFGGDEFVIICRDCADAHEALDVADRLRAALGEPYAIGDVELRIGASIGVALADGATPAAALLHHADRAAYQAKAAGRNSVRLARPADPAG